MFCHKCGSSLANDAVFCSRCGARMPSEPNAAAQAAQAAPPPAAPSPAAPPPPAAAPPVYAPPPPAFANQPAPGVPAAEAQVAHRAGTVAADPRLEREVWTGRFSAKAMAQWLIALGAWAILCIVLGIYAGKWPW